MTIQFQQAQYSFTESDGNVSVCLIISDVPTGGIERDVVVGLGASDDTAGKN